MNNISKYITEYCSIWRCMPNDYWRKRYNKNGRMALYAMMFAIKQKHSKIKHFSGRACEQNGRNKMAQKKEKEWSTGINMAMMYQQSYRGKGVNEWRLKEQKAVEKTANPKQEKTKEEGGEN